MNQYFAENLLKLRKQHHMTQEQLAKKLGISFQSVSKWENDQGYPNIEMWPQIAAVFETSIDALLGYQSQKMQTTHYEKKYEKEEYYWGNKIWDGCYEVLKRKPITGKIRLLDIGCGEGQAAVFFAKNGYSVSAFDISKNGIEKAKSLAEGCCVSVDFFGADMVEYRLDNQFDVIFSSGALQYIPEDKRKEVVFNWKEHTRFDGIHVLNVFVKKPFLEIPLDWEETEYFWKSGELLRYYWDWQIEKTEEFIFECNSGGTAHQHCMNVVIARKRD